MNIFLSKYQNKIDKKGRVSIPSAFRSVLSEDKFNGIIIYPSFKNNCIEACSMARLQEIYGIIQKLDPYSEERDAFETWRTKPCAGIIPRWPRRRIQHW